MAQAIGVDLGGTNARAQWIDLATLATRGEASALLPAEEDARTPERVADLVASLVHGLGAPAGTPIGIGVAAMIGPSGVVVNAPAFPGGWRGAALGELLARRLGSPPCVENDVNAIAWGEHRYGAGRGVDDLLCVFIGTGVGGGIVAGGRLVRGAAGLAGEIGHGEAVQEAEALPCGCGRRGCLEAYAGGGHLARRAQVLRDDLARVLPALGNAAPHAGHLDQAAQAGFAPAREILEEAARHLARALATASALLDPAVVILGGGVWTGAPFLRARTLAAWDDLTSGREHGRPPLVTSQLGPRAGVLGAAHLAMLATSSAHAQ